jgi:hypothetical protein
VSLHRRPLDLADRVLVTAEEVPGEGQSQDHRIGRGGTVPLRSDFAESRYREFAKSSGTGTFPPRAVTITARGVRRRAAGPPTRPRN